MNIQSIEQELKETRKKIDQAKEILKNPEDRELLSLAEEEIKQCEKKEKELEEQLQNAPKKNIVDKEKTTNKSNTQSIIIEIRAGAGGDEAAIFANDLFRMYSRYAMDQGWDQKILESHATGLEGVKEVAFQLKGENAWNQLKQEAGVHRVQRIPKTEKSGRIHTSTASVAVMLKPKKTETTLRPDDLRIDIFRSSGPGGQNVNKRETAVRVTHIPSGIVVASQNERNQLRNKENALAILEARLLEKETREEVERSCGERKAQIGGAMRAEKIRTYNFPQDRVTDHRIGKKWHNIEDIMAGKLKPIIKAFAHAVTPESKTE